MSKTHHTLSSISETIRQINISSTSDAEKFMRENKLTSKTGVFIRMPLGFLKSFISGKGIDNGYGRFYDSFFKALRNFLTRLKLLKLMGRI